MMPEKSPSSRIFQTIARRLGLSAYPAEAMYSSTPVVTLLGDSVVGRIAASVSIAAGIPDTVVSTLAEYERVAINLATNATLLADLRSRLTTAIWAGGPPFFDNARWVRDWEELLLATFHAAWQGAGRAVSER